MNAIGLSDEDLMKRIAHGDREAFAVLYERAAPRAMGLLMQLLRNRADAEETLQEVMLEIWRKASKYDANLANPIAWLLLIARARGIDRIRKRSRTQKHLEAHAQDQESLTQPEDFGDYREPLGRAIDELPLEQRNVLALAYYQGMQRDRIAQIEGIPVGTVKTRLRAAVLSLREALQVADVA